MDTEISSLLKVTVHTDNKRSKRFLSQCIFYFIASPSHIWIGLQKEHSFVNKITLSR